MINFQENDPTTPSLVVPLNIPSLPSPCPPIGVQNFTGNDGPPESVEHQSANVYCTMALSLTYIQSVLKNPLTAWQFRSKLIAEPRSGKMFNAYYDRAQLNFFFDTDPQTQQTIYACDSTDVVSHELGHAILDALRPDFWAVQCVEIQAFHEAFGDCNAILTALSFPEVLKYVMTETNGDLKNENVVARIAEQMGAAIWHAEGHTGPKPDNSLRNANNHFQYSPPEQLPTRLPEDQISGEPHNFSRVFAGAWYDALVNVYNVQKQNKPAEEALIAARDLLGGILLNGIRSAPYTSRFYGAVLQAMLNYDLQNNLGCGDSIRSAFAAHAINPTTLKLIVAEIKPISMMTDLKTTKLSAFHDKHDLLISVVLPIASPLPLTLDGHGGLHEAIASAQYSVKVLTDHDRIGPNKEFAVVDNHLVRNHYWCYNSPHEPSN